MNSGIFSRPRSLKLCKPGLLAVPDALDLADKPPMGACQFSSCRAIRGCSPAQIQQELRGGLSDHGAVL